MFVLKTLIFVYSLFSVGDAKFVDSLTQCSIADGGSKCLTPMFQNIIKTYANSGIPEYNIPIMDPMEIKHMSMKVIDTLTGTITNATIHGFKKCLMQNVQLNLDKRTAKQEITCNLTVKGSVALSGNHPAMQAIFGTSSVEIYGNGKLKLEKLKITFQNLFEMFKKDDNEVYLKMSDKDVKYQYDLYKAKFSAEKITIGNEDITKLAVDYLNNFYRDVMKLYGKTFIDLAVPIYQELENRLFMNVPAKYYILEDLSSEVDN